jgi:hypothetical protein
MIDVGDVEERTGAEVVGRAGHEQGKTTAAEDES